MIKKIAHTLSTSKPTPRLFLFAGQGTQEVGMLASIPEKQRNQALNLAHSLLGLDLAEISVTDKNKVINQTQITQPLLMLSHYLHFRKQGYNLNITQDDYMIGHSLGQFSALVNSGSLSLQDGLKLVHLRGQLMKKHTTSPHGMLIVKYKPQKESSVRQAIIQAGLQIACINTKTSLVVAGKTTLIESLLKTLKSLHASALTLPVSTAFHCKMLQPMKQQFAQALQQVAFNTPKCTVLRNYDCLPFTDQANIRQGLLLQLTNPVRFCESVERVPMSAQVIEVGHKAGIARFAEQVRRAKFMADLI